ncbi:translocation protein TolB [Neorhodopirellula pilleata]|uniref:Translocation protein TolB n=2 Tax=Neorhodopirellula pilleata TaxID=2714738 RepID=A0A5C6A4D1_9BACT|nr:translocation protein TolB [Neorhodopirellula pilleata]
MRLGADELNYRPPEKATMPMTLSIFRVDGSELRDLVVLDDSTERIASPAWSPDDLFIAFEQFPGDVDLSRIKKVKVEGGLVTDLGAGTVPDFSSDGKQIAFSARNEGIGIMNSDGSERRILERHGWGLIWSPNPSELFFSNYRKLIRLDVSTGRQTSLFSDTVTNELTQVFWNLDWSPDGQRIAFNAMDRSSNKRQLLVTSLSKPQPPKVLLSGLRYSHVDHCWSPDGNRILIQIDQPGSIGRQLFLLDVDQAGAPIPLSSAPSDRIVFGADWSHDGKWIAIASQPIPQIRRWNAPPE